MNSKANATYGKHGIERIYASDEKLGLSEDELQVVLLAPIPGQGLSKGSCVSFRPLRDARIGGAHRPELHIYRGATKCDSSPKKPHDER